MSCSPSFRAPHFTEPVVCRSRVMQTVVGPGVTDGEEESAAFEKPGWTGRFWVFEPQSLSVTMT